MKAIYNSLEGLKPVILMLFVQILSATVNIITKLAINDGMSMRVATAYRFIFASAVTIPLALIFDRKKRQKITWKVLFLAFICGLFGYVTVLFRFSCICTSEDPYYHKMV
ncbi:hypothetical protein KIW84_072430 [Lathyrus oleraceus]|uniref:WAT1-related protein n=1 Tax=Pisum sativum TaxID=3888 RepID=A0A9D4VM92_PEA|nr:hypothetical protein KIW84_072430 [Pisum sativum]